MCRRSVIQHMAAVCVSAAVCASAAAEVGVSSALEDRVDLSALSRPHLVMRFDFDETQHGNYSDIPMFWERHVAAGFPQYVKGTFDREVGDTAPPSFRLDLNAGSVAYHYRAPIIRVKPSSDYQVTASIRTTQLAHARAWLSSCFLDSSGTPLPGSERTSPLFGGEEEHAEWQPITVFLTGGNKRATHLGLSVWLAQRAHWHVGPRPPHWVDYREVRGSAWLDDIEITPLPHRILEATSPGNLFGAEETVRLHVNVEDSSNLELTAQLDVYGADGRAILNAPVRIRRKHDPPQSPVELPGLPAGLYTARMRIHAHKGVLSDTHLTFAKLAPKHLAAMRHSTQYGLVLEHLDESQFDAYTKLVAHLGVGRVKFPVGLQLLTGDAANVSNPGRDGFLRRLTANRQRLVATFADQPDPQSEDPSGDTTILDIVDNDPEVWRPGLSLVLAHFADLAYFWQLAPDGQEAVLWDKRMGDGLKRLGKEFAGMLTDPSFVVPWSAHLEPPDPATDPAGSAEYISVHVPGSMPPHSIEAHLRSFTASTKRDTWAVIEPPAQNRYLREPRLADVAKRLIFARWSGAHTVFTPPLWRARERVGGRIIEPTEDYLVFRTVADVVGRGRPAGSIYLGPTVRCRIFDRGGPATLAIWDDAPPPDGRTLLIKVS